MILWCVLLINKMSVWLTKFVNHPVCWFYGVFVLINKTALSTNCHFFKNGPTVWWPHRTRGLRTQGLPPPSVRPILPLVKKNDQCFFIGFLCMIKFITVFLWAIDFLLVLNWFSIDTCIHVYHMSSSGWITHTGTCVLSGSLHTVVRRTKPDRHAKWCDFSMRMCLFSFLISSVRLPLWLHRL